MHRAARAPRAKGWARQPTAASAERRGHPSPLCDHQEGATPGSPWLPLPERAAPDGSTRGDDEGQEQSPANIASWRVATNEARSGRSGDGHGPPDEGRVRREAGQALAQPGRRAVLGGIGAPPRCSERPEGGLWDSPGRDGSKTRPYRSGLGHTRADGPPSPPVASLLPLAVRAGALAFAGLVGIRKGTLTARPDRQAVGVPSMIPPLLGFVRGGTAPPIRASLPWLLLRGRAAVSSCAPSGIWRARRVAGGVRSTMRA
jgi:hypothetical protein